MTEDLDRLDVLAAAATPGPWEPFADTKAPLYGRVGCVAVAETREPICGGTNGTDATFIAACDPATIRSLLAAVRERDELRAALDEIRTWVENKKRTPWTESGSFASRMTGEQGYDAAIEEVEALVR